MKALFSKQITILHFHVPVLTLSMLYFFLKYNYLTDTIIGEPQSQFDPLEKEVPCTKRKSDSVSSVVAQIVQSFLKKCP